MSDSGNLPSHQVTVVVVEDHPLVRLGVTDLLTTAGLDVVATAGTSEEGRRLISARRPAVAVIDSRLPDGLGIDLCRRLSLEAPDVLTVLYSSSTTAQDRRDALAAGAVAAVTKTIHGYELLEAINECTLANDRRPSNDAQRPDA